MMGRTHVVSSGLMNMGVMMPVFGTREYVVSTICAAGAGLVNDFDQPSSTIARTFGWPTRVLAKIVGKISGGHRFGTHSFPGIAVIICGVLVLLQQWPYTTTWVLAVILVGLFADVFLYGPGIISIIIRTATSFSFVYVMTYLGISWWWLPLSLTIGMVTHTLGDSLTEDKVRWFYPFSMKKFGINVCKTDSSTETVIQFACWVGVAVVIFYNTTSWQAAVTYLTG